MATAAIPEGLGAMVPGPALCALLEAVDVTAIGAAETVSVFVAAYRQLSHAQSVMLAAAVEMGVRSPSPEDPMGRMDCFDEWSDDEARAAVALTRVSAGRLMDLAWGTVRRLPELHEAMRAGVLDEARARLFCEWTAELSDAHATAVVAALLPAAARSSTGQLRERIQKQATALDPDWARRRYVAALKAGRVVGRRNPDGTADLCGLNLPPDRVAAACGRVDALAKAAKRDGDPRRIDDLRVELYLGMIEGTYGGLSDEQILAHLAANRPEPESEEAARARADGEAAARRAAERDAARYGLRVRKRRGGGEPAGGHAGDPAADPGAEVADDCGPADVGPADVGPADVGPADAGPERAERVVGKGVSRRAAKGRREDLPIRVIPPSGPPAGSSPAGSSPAGPPPAGPPPAGPSDGPTRREPPRVGVELQVRLSAILGLDDLPAELAGHGPIHAEYARDLLAGLGAAQWRFAVTGPGGHLLAGGLTPTRPTGFPRRSYRCQALVELAIPEPLLHELLTLDPSILHRVDPVVLAAWADVIADLGRRFDLHHSGVPPPGGTDDPRRRFPSAALRRHVRLRKRRCVGPVCRAPARDLDLDHTTDHAKGGQTVEENLGPACGHDHGLKHDGGWGLRMIDDHTYEWTSRLGHVHRVELPPVIEDLPDPMPERDREPAPEPERWGPDPDHDAHGRPWQDSTSWPDEPARPEPATDPEPGPPLPPELDIPPF